MIELKQRQLANPLAFFTPNGKQEEFITLRNFINVFSAGNGAGKTIIATNILGNLCYGPQNKWFDKPIYHNFRRPFRGRIVSTHKNIKESIVPKIKEWFPRGRWDAFKEKQEYMAKWHTDTGVEFDIMTYDTAPEQHEGPTIHFIWYDEPPPQLIFGAGVSRLREGGLIIITMTPLYAGGWIFDRINNPFRKQEDWFLVMADIEDNCVEHGVRGTLRHKDIERMIAEYPADEREARIKGVPIYLSGRVYKGFDPEVHVIPRNKLPASGTLYHACDPHDRKPFALGWYLVDDTGDIYVIGEWPDEPFHEMKSCSLGINDYGKIIEEKEKSFNKCSQIRIIDARYGNRKNVQTGDTIRDAFDDYRSDYFPDGIIYINSYTDNDSSLLAGHQAVKELLRYDKEKPLSHTNKPKIYVCEDCTNHIYGFLHYAYSDYRDPEKGIKEKVDPKDKDFMDLVRYAVGEVYPNLLELKDERTNIDSLPDYMPERWRRYREDSMQRGYGG